MEDACVITRDESGVDEAVLDQNTGELVDPVPGTTYEGACLVKAPSGLSNRPQEQGGQIYTQSEYQLKLPLSALGSDSEPNKGDFVLITASLRDPALVGKTFRIIDVAYKTMAISRTCTLEFRG